MPKPTRDDVIRQMLSATTRTEIASARAAQQSWLQAHPDDRFPLLQAGEQLTMVERTAPAKSRVNPGNLARAISRRRKRK